MKRVILVLVFSSLIIGLRAQCDSFVAIKISFEEQIKLLELREIVPIGWEEPVDTNEVRRIYFIHGLGGDKSSWSQAAEACEIGSSGFPARKCETIREDYTSSTNSLYLAASDVRTAIGNQADIDRGRGILDPSRAIIIAHSQGGVVARELMHLDMVQPGNSGTGHTTLHSGMNYGGVVTIASPLQGARILNNRQLILDLAEDACKKLSAGYLDDAARGISNEINIPFKNIKDKLTGKLGGLMNDVVCGTAANTVLPMFFNAYYKGITDSYTVGASMIDTLNRDTLNTQYRKFPKMAFYAVEPQINIFWRTLNWTVNNPNNADYFEANDDWKLLDSTFMSEINKCQAKRKAHYAEANRLLKLTNIPFIGVFFWGKKYSHEVNSYLAWQKGEEWYNNVNGSWQYVIGAKVKNGNTVIVDPENDGIVLAESAMDLPGATHKSIEIYPNKDKTVDFEKGSTHMQVRNDAGLKEHLFKLFEGKYDRWFYVPEQK